MGIGVLGPLTVDSDTAALGPRDRLVLSALATQPGVALRTEQLADVLWGEQPPATWPKVVQGCIARLRKQLGVGAIETVPQGYRLTLAADAIDAARFERQAARAKELLVLGEADRAAFIADEALVLWRGKPFAELEEWEAGRGAAARLEELRAGVEELRVDAYLRAGRTSQTLAEAQTLVEREPLRERRWALLAVAQYQAGRQAEALASLRKARAVLAEQLGVDPGPELAELEQAILRQDPSLVAHAALPETSTTCPYLGLLAYGVDDADAFFGREQDVAACMHRLTEAGVLAVVGPSGSGKSSLIRAGVVAALHRDGHRIVIITPGPQPLDALTALPASGSAPVLVVDQCEEAITLCQDAGERSQFFAALTRYAEQAPVIVALRADRFGEVSAHPDFARLVERGLYLLKAMEEADLRAAIEGPARQAGLLLEGGLGDLLIRDVEGEPGALPLLSHALRQTWQRREGRTLTVDGYHASGGIRGAVAQTAEQLYEQTDGNQQRILRDLLLRLVTPSPNGDPVRSRVPRRLVASDSEHEAVIEQLVHARLVTSDADVVELAHEALARAWPRLQDWLDDDVEGQRLWRHLALAAETWEAMGRPDSELYRGVRLAKAWEWHHTSAPDLNPVEQAFLDASQQHADAEVAVARRRRRNLVSTLAAGLTVMTLLAATALVAQQRANREADVARARELAAAAISVLDDDPSLAKLLAVASATMAEPNLESISALHRVWAADRIVSRNGSTFEAGLIWADLDPSGERAVVAGTFPVEGTGQAMEVVDLVSDERVWSLSYERDNTSVFLVAPFYSADGEQVVVGAVWDPDSIHRFNEETEQPRSALLGAHIFDAESGELMHRYDLGRCGGWVAGASETHLLVRTLHGAPDVVESCRWVDGTWAVELLDRQSGARRVLSADLRGWWGAAVSGDGRYVAYDDESTGTVAVIEVATGDHLLSFDGGGVRALNHDGSLLVYDDDPIEVRDVATGEVAATFDDHVGGTLFARFGPSGRTVFSTGRDGVLREWDAQTGKELLAHPGLGNGRPSFSRDGLVLVAQPDLDVLTLLDTRVRGEVGAVETCAGFVWDDGLTVVDGLATFHVDCGDDDDVTAYVVDLESRAVIHTLPGHRARALAVSPDGARFVRQDGEGTERGRLVVRDLHTREEIVELDPSASSDVRVYRLRWSPDGTMIAAGFDTQVAVWDAETGAILYHQPADPDQIFTVDLLFSPDSTRLVTSSANWVVRAISTQSWEQLVERDLMMVDGGYSVGWIGHTTDGSLLAAGAFLGNTAGALHWFDPETLDVTRRQPNAHGGSIKAMALHEDGSYAATGSSDGFVRVWDTATGDLAHEIPFGSTQVQGVAFMDDHRLAVTLEEGNLLVVTTSVDDLLDLVRSSLTRGFTATECAKYGFDDNCPTLVDLRGPLPGTDDPGVLNGTFRVEWTEDELTAEWVAVGDREEFAREAAAFDAGVIDVTFADGRFDVVKTQDAPTRLCTGSYSVRGDRAWLLAEHYGICDGRVKMFDATFALADDALHFDDLRGHLSEQIIFATRPLRKID